MVFADPSGVLDVYGLNTGNESYFLDPMDEDFLRLIRLVSGSGPGYVFSFEHINFKLDWHQVGPDGWTRW